MALKKPAPEKTVEKATKDRLPRFSNIQCSDITDVTQDAIVLVTMDGTIADWNQSAERIYGYAKADIIGKPIRQIVPDKAQSNVMAIIDRIKKGRRLVLEEGEHKSKDGKVFHVSLSMAPMVDPKGNLIGIIGVARDLTGRIKVSAEQERYRDFLENISDACFETDLKGTVTYVNKAAEQRSGFRRNEMIGIAYKNFTSPKEAERIYKIFNNVYHTGQPGIIRNYEMHNPDGQHRWVEMAVTLMRDTDGKKVGFRGVSRDVTESKNIQ